METREHGLGGLAKVLLFLAILGAVNWGLIGFFNWNLVDAILGGGAREETSGIARVVYAIVGLSGLGLLFLLPKLAERREVLRTRAGSTGSEVRP